MRELVAYSAPGMPRSAVPEELECAHCSFRFEPDEPTPHHVCPMCQHVVDASG